MKHLFTLIILIQTLFISDLLAWRDLETGAYFTRDPAGFIDGPNMYTYVRQNPWTYIDPLGLKIEDVSDKDDPDTTKLKITGVIIDHSGSKIDLDKAKKQISDAIKDSFNGKYSDDKKLEIEVDIKPVESAEEIAEDDHVFNIAGDNLHPSFNGEAENGGSIITIRNAFFIVNNSSDEKELKWVIAHETGHSLGLYHPSNVLNFLKESKPSDGEDVGIGIDLRGLASNSNNLMRYNENKTTEVTHEQRKRIISKLKNEELNDFSDKKITDPYWSTGERKQEIYDKAKTLREKLEEQRSKNE